MTSIQTLELEEDIDSYAAYIREVTDDGQAIVDCLIRIMEDESVGAKPHERLDAQLLLDSIGFGRLAVDQASTAPPADAPPPEPASPDPPRPANPRSPRRPAFVISEETLFHLPPLVRQKTDMGRKTADFLNSVVRGELSDFRPHHWIRAVKHLAARAYSKDRNPNLELPGPTVEDTRSLIQTLVTAYRERKAEEAASGPPTDLDPAGAAEPDDVPGQPPHSSRRSSVLDHDYAPPCPYGSHIPGCQCAAEAEELYGLARKHLRQSPDHPP